MIRVIAWKEYREQTVIWVAVVVLALLAVGALAALHPHGLAAGDPDVILGLTLATIGLATTYGLVCGAMLLAGEREAGTLAFLDTLPARRWQVWGAKLLAGLTLALLQGLVLAAVAVGFGLPLPSWDIRQGDFLSHGHWFWILPAAAVEGCAWGLLGSALSRNVLAAVLVAALMNTGIWCVGIMPMSAHPALLVGAVCVRAGLALGALGLSVLLFARGDLDRIPTPAPAREMDEEEGEEAEPGPRRVRRGRGRSALGAVVWLAVRQGRVGIAVLGVAALLMGLLLPAEGPLFWPVTTLVAGIFCGAAVYLGEQEGGFYRFLGDQRLPPGKVWGLKTLFWFGVAVAACVLVWLGAWQHFVGAKMRTGHGLLDAAWQALPLVLHRNNLLVPLALWLLYGFSVGETCALAWRKSVAALFMALVIGPAVAAVWLPSVVAGGLPAWQVFAVPALLLALNRLLYWPWVAGGLYTARPLALLAAGVLLGLAWTAGCLAYRVVSVPDVAPPFDLAAFADSLPTPEHNPAGLDIRAAVAQLPAQEEAAKEAVQPRAPFPAGAGGMGGMAPGGGMPGMGGAPPGAPAEELGTEVQVREILAQGWSAAPPKLGKWLDVLFRGDWAQALRNGTAQPLGLVEDPRQVTLNSRFTSLVGCQRAAGLFAVRALQLQARGDDAAALDHLLVVLALSRQLRHNAPPIAWHVGVEVERTALTGLDGWLDRAARRPELLRRALAELARHERETPPAAEAVEASYLSMQNRVEDPTLLVQLYALNGETPADRTTAPLMEAAWQAPWERARTERLLRLLYAGWLRGTEAPFAEVAGEQERLLQELPPHSLTRALGGQILNGWLPAGGDSGDPLTPERLGDLVVASWLPDVLRGPQPLALEQALSRCDVRGHRLSLALALYQAEKGKPAPDLEVLVREGYLEELPRDPFSGEPFHYRVSTGEVIEGEPRSPGFPQAQLRLPAGTGVVWSVGPDLHDDGGTRQGFTAEPRLFESGRAFDLIFLVPPPLRR